MAYLALDLFGGKRFLRTCYQMHGDKPILEGEFAALHHRSAFQRCTMTTALTFPLFPVLLPIVVSVSTFPALYTFL
jgi:hypothetical protein